jgi:hypothetical protein
MESVKFTCDVRYANTYLRRARVTITSEWATNQQLPEK